MDRFYVKRLLMILFLASISINYLNAQVTDTIHIKAKWNMVSLPVKVQDAHYLTIFPGALSQPFEHSTGYPPETLRIGRAYWMLFASDTTYLITGEPIQSTIRDVWAGWNMVGSISEPILISNIQSDPPGIVVSDFFEYNAAPGYKEADTIVPGSGYWVKVNQAGELFLSSIGYPCPGTPMIEYEGKTYHTVQIGNQCWLKENLDIGVMINGNQNQTNNGTIEKYCYDDNPTNCNKYGGLYQWEEAMQYTNTSGAQGICPQGWHIPTLSEFDSLNFTVMNDDNALKAIGQGTGIGAGTNTSGFSCLLGGNRNYEGNFSWLGYYGELWSSDTYTSNGAFYGYLYCCNTPANGLNVGYSLRADGRNIRCLKD